MTNIKDFWDILSFYYYFLYKLYEIVVLRIQLLMNFVVSPEIAHCVAGVLCIDVEYVWEFLSGHTTDRVVTYSTM